MNEKFVHCITASKLVHTKGDSGYCPATREPNSPYDATGSLDSGASSFDGVQMRCKNTFLEVCLPPMPSMPRSQTSPNLSSPALSFADMGDSSIADDLIYIEDFELGQGSPIESATSARPRLEDRSTKAEPLTSPSVDMSQTVTAENANAGWASPRPLAPPDVSQYSTVMIRNIPNKASQMQIAEFLTREGFAKEFDFMYSPRDFVTKMNLGYAFVNMTSPDSADRLFKELEGLVVELNPNHLEAGLSRVSKEYPAYSPTGGRQSKAVYSSVKKLTVSWARIQGLQSNILHYRNSPINFLEDEYRPALFECKGQVARGEDGQIRVERVEFPKPDRPGEKPHQFPSGDGNRHGARQKETGAASPQSVSYQQHAIGHGRGDQQGHGHGHGAGYQQGHGTGHGPMSAVGSRRLGKNWNPSESTSMPPVHMHRGGRAGRYSQADGASYHSSSRPSNTSQGHGECSPSGLSDGGSRDMKIFVGGLDLDTSDETLRQYFSQFGIIAESAVVRQRHTGISKGFGFVKFTDHSAVEEVLDTQSHPVHWVDGMAVAVRAYTSVRSS